MADPEDLVCKCGNREFGHLCEWCRDIYYCKKCLATYDEDGNEIQEGEYDPDDPDHERDIKEDDLC